MLSNIIKQTVLHGSVFLALDKNIFTPLQLLEWIISSSSSTSSTSSNSSTSVSNLILISYKAVCTKISPENHMIDGFLEFINNPNNINFRSIAVHYGLQNYPVENDNVDKVNLIIGGDVSIEYSKINIDLLLKSLNMPKFYINQNKLDSLLVDCDWIDNFKINEDLIKLLLRRIVYIQITAPLYYVSVLQPIYRQLITKLYQDKLFCRVSKKDFLLINNFFPGIISDDILNFDEFTYKIYKQNNILAGYILGFPIQHMTPTNQQIINSLQLLMKIGPDQYIEKVSRYTEEFTKVTSVFDDPLHPINFINNENFLLEKINEYSPFDIISHRVDNLVYRFTRDEFENLHKTRKNHWTNEELVINIFYSITTRQLLSEEFLLPPAKTLRDLYEEIKNGTFLADEDFIDQSQIFINDISLKAFSHISWNPGYPQNSS